MRKNTLVLISFCFMFASLQAINRYPILPAPTKMVEQKGNFVISPSTVVTLGTLETETLPVVKFLTERLQKSYGFILKVNSGVTGNKNCICFETNKALGDEEYTLSVQPDRIKITYSSPAGAFYALQTLLQLFPSEIYGNTRINTAKVSLPCVLVNDSPRFQYRGLMLDVGRHFMPVEFIKQYIDMMAMCKINRFHWHLTEDQGWRIEIKKYPRLTEIGSKRKQTSVGNWRNGIYDGKPYGGFYTQDEAREIVRYAAARYITVIPEIELPGHSLAAIASYPNLSCKPDSTYNVGEKWGVSRVVYCPKEETFTFLQDVFSELFTIFPSAYYHIGGDECPKNSWKACAHCQDLIRRQGLKDENELQSYFIGRIEKFLNAHGKNIIGWDEILEGGLAPKATVMSWRGEKGGIAAARQKHQVIMSPNTYCYLNFSQTGAESDSLEFGRNKFLPLETVYNYEPYPEELTIEEQSYIIGVQGNIWTEFIETPERVMEMTFPRAFAIAETAWSPATIKNYNSFKNRILPMFSRMDIKGLKYSDSFYSPVFYFDRKSKVYPKTVEIKTDYPHAEIFYTTDGTTPTLHSKKYNASFALKNGETIKAVSYAGNKQIGVVRMLK